MRAIGLVLVLAGVYVAVVALVANRVTTLSGRADYLEAADRKAWERAIEALRTMP